MDCPQEIAGSAGGVVGRSERSGFRTIVGAAIKLSNQPRCISSLPAAAAAARAEELESWMRFSIVTPSFRQLEWLSLCVASVADQKGVKVEHIVQDAGTGPELERWAHAQSRVRLFVEADNGMYDAINRGLKRGTGEICSYLNCDEQYLPGALAKVATFFAAHPETEVLFGDFVLANVRGDPISYRRMVLPSLRHLRLAPLSTGSCATFFRRRLLDDGFYFDPQWKASGDAVWMETLLRANIRMDVLHEPLAVFTFTGQNLGQATISHGEGVRRKATTARGIRLRRAAVLVRHRLRKMLAGAYRRRRIDISIYTLESPTNRQRRVGERVGFGWPSQ